MLAFFTPIKFEKERLIALSLLIHILLYTLQTSQHKFNNLMHFRYVTKTQPLHSKHMRATSQLTRQ
jgi:hypothetical protein